MKNICLTNKNKLRMEKKYFHGANIERQGKKIGVILFIGSCAEIYGEIATADGKKEIKIVDCFGRQTFMPRAVLIQHVTGTGDLVKKFARICLKRLERQMFPRKK